MTTAPALLRYLLIDRAGAQLRLPRLRGVPGHSQVRAQILLLHEIATDLDGYPRQLVAPGTDGLLLLVSADTDAAVNEPGSRLLATLGHDMQVRGPLAVCAVRGEQMRSLDREQVGLLLLRLAHPGWRRWPRQADTGTRRCSDAAARTGSPDEYTNPDTAQELCKLKCQDHQRWMLSRRLCLRRGCQQRQQL